MEVSLVQKLLKKLGYDITLNATFDSQTEQAVIAFQQKQGLQPHGIVNDSTWISLLCQKFENQLFINGIDVSHYENEEFLEGKFPFEQLKYFDLQFCFIKGSHGADRKDDFFQYNFKKLEEEHLIRGAYHFFSLLNDDIDTQINNYLSLEIDFSQPGILPPVLDIEEDSRPFDKDNIILNRDKVVERMKKWLTTIEAKTGRIPIIYCRKSFWEKVIGSPEGFERYPLWAACYKPEFPPLIPDTWQGKWHFWQYTDKGVLDGIGKYDLNRFSGTYVDLLQLANFKSQLLQRSTE